MPATLVSVAIPVLPAERADFTCGCAAVVADTHVEVRVCDRHAVVVYDEEVAPV